MQRLIFFVFYFGCLGSLHFFQIFFLKSHFNLFEILIVGDILDIVLEIIKKIELASANFL